MMNNKVSHLAQVSCASCVVVIFCLDGTFWSQFRDCVEIEKRRKKVKRHFPNQPVVNLPKLKLSQISLEIPLP